MLLDPDTESLEAARDCPVLGHPLPRYDSDERLCTWG
jgi:hypothetical protein